MSEYRLSRRQLLVTGACVSTYGISKRAAHCCASLSAEYPGRALEDMSHLEVTGDSDALNRFYGLMHPDAQGIIPAGIVIHYSLDAYQPLGPKPAVVATTVTYQDWTWEVTGVTYPQAAEVSFRQDFADGAIEGVAHLVRHDTRWA